jgi:hypothetical protein
LFGLELLRFQRGRGHHPIGHNACCRRKGVLAVVGLDGAPKKVLQMSNIITLLKEYPDKFQALKELMN